MLGVNMVIWSLFDGSGIMVLPWAEAGHRCYCFNFDGADHGEYVVKMQHENIIYVNKWIDGNFDFPGRPDMIFAFPSCTQLAASGSKHDRDDDDVSNAIASAVFVEQIANRYSVPWFVENPVGKLCTAWRKPDMYFDPWEFGGYMSEDDDPWHPKMPKFDGYTKKTGIWCGNGFKLPGKRPGPVNIGFFWGWKYLGGKSAKTKQLRSLTPRGFARAVFEANSGD